MATCIPWKVTQHLKRYALKSAIRLDTLKYWDMGRFCIQTIRGPLAGKGKMNNNTYERKVDALGRVMLPKEVRDVLELRPGLAIHFEIVSDKVMFNCEAANA